MGSVLFLSVLYTNQLIKNLIYCIKKSMSHQFGDVVFFGMFWFAFSAAKVETTAQTTATVTTGDDCSAEEYGFTPTTGQNEVCVYVLFAKLFRDIEAKGSVIVINITFGYIRQYAVRSVYVFEFFSGL